MMWIIDVMMGFTFGYLYAFIKYRKRELDIITQEKMEDFEERETEKTKNQNL